MLCHSTLSSWYDCKTILFSLSLFLLPIYWYALSFEDYHHWSASLECEKGNMSRRNEKDELDKLEVRKTEGSKEGKRQRDIINVLV